VENASITEVPTKEDISKLNAEINSYLNQQFTSMIATVTIIGLVVSWVSQKVSTVDPATADIAFLGCLALLVFLGLMVVVEARLQVAIDILAIYLRLSGVSVWEQQHSDFVQLSKSKYGFRFTSRHLFLGTSVAIASFWPFVLSIVAFGRVHFTPTVYFFMAAALLAVIFVFALMPQIVHRRIRHIQRTWKEVLGHLPRDE
jgi:hypothetical protein